MSNEKKEFNIGDLVVVFKLIEENYDEEHFNNGSFGEITLLVHNKFLVDFSNTGKSEWGNDVYYVEPSQVKHYTPVEDLPLWKSNHMHLNEAQQQALRKLLHRVQWDEEYAEKIDFNSLKSFCISEAFLWEYTEEGHYFWEIADGQCNSEQVQLPVKEDSSTVEEQVEEVSIDNHYNFFYEMTRQESDNMQIKIDPYFVSKQWKLGEKDNSGVLFHCLKTIARFGDKNTIEREITALHKQIKRLAELNNVDLEGE